LWPDLVQVGGTDSASAAADETLAPEAASLFSTSHACKKQSVPIPAMQQQQHQISNQFIPTNIQHPTSDIRHSTSDIQHPTSNIRHPTADIQQPKTNIGTTIANTKPQPNCSENDDSKREK
jgi:hypothetical protein